MSLVGRLDVGPRVESGSVVSIAVSGIEGPALSSGSRFRVFKSGVQIWSLAETTGGHQG